RLGDRRAVPQLLRALELPDHALAAAESLGPWAGDPDVQPALERLVGRWLGDPLVKVRAAEGLARAGHADARRHLEKAARAPHDAARIPDGALAEIERLAQTHPRVVAVGETGLDYHYHHSPREQQQQALRDFIGIARRAKKPLSLHIRDAHDDALGICADEDA